MARGARSVAVGILASRVAGLVRERVLAVLFGISPWSDVVRLALRTPNLVQNLLGEQALSAAFIPVYSRMVAEGRRDEARRLAGAVFGLLAVVAGTVALAGALLAPWVVRVFAPGLAGDAAKVAAGELAIDRLALTAEAVRIVFPMTALLVLSAWALGVLNSHRRFLLPYAAPVVWNAAIIASAVAVALESGALGRPSDASFGTLSRLVFAVAWGALAGGALQLAVQLPTVIRLLGGFRPWPSLRAPGVRKALRAFAPALAGRGVFQLSTYLDMVLASFLRAGAVAALGWAAALAQLPISLFGMAVAAAELPDLADDAGRSGDGAAARLVRRVRDGLRQSAFLVAPTVVGYLAFGLLVSGLLYRGGRFSVADNWLVYLVLAGYAVGLLPTTASRLLQNTFFALGDTRTPARVAAGRLALSAGVGVAAMVVLDRLPLAAVAPVLDEGGLRLGAVGLAIASSVGAWGELGWLTRALRRALPGLGLPWREIGGSVLRSLLAALPAAALDGALAGAPFVARALLVLSVYAGAYLGLAAWERRPELAGWWGRSRARGEGPADGDGSRGREDDASV